MLRISPASVYRLIEKRQVPFYRFPHKLRFSKRDVEAYLKEARTDAIAR
jgi:excisionase family DNA binding protein